MRNEANKSTVFARNAMTSIAFALLILISSEKQILAQAVRTINLPSETVPGPIVFNDYYNRAFVADQKGQRFLGIGRNATAFDYNWEFKGAVQWEVADVISDGKLIHATLNHNQTPQLGKMISFPSEKFQTGYWSNSSYDMQRYVSSAGKKVAGLVKSEQDGAYFEMDSDYDAFFGRSEKTIVWSVAQDDENPSGALFRYYSRSDDESNGSYYSEEPYVKKYVWWPIMWDMNMYRKGNYLTAACQNEDWSFDIDFQIDWIERCVYDNSGGDPMCNPLRTYGYACTTDNSCYAPLKEPRAEPCINYGAPRIFPEPYCEIGYYSRSECDNSSPISISRKLTGNLSVGPSNLLFATGESNGVPALLQFHAGNGIPTFYILELPDISSAVDLVYDASSDAIWLIGQSSTGILKKIDRVSYSAPELFIPTISQTINFNDIAPVLKIEISEDDKFVFVLTQTKLYQVLTQTGSIVSTRNVCSSPKGMTMTTATNGNTSEVWVTCGGLSPKIEVYGIDGQGPIVGRAIDPSNTSLLQQLASLSQVQITYDRQHSTSFYASMPKNDSSNVKNIYYRHYLKGSQPPSTWSQVRNCSDGSLDFNAKTVLFHIGPNIMPFGENIIEVFARDAGGNPIVSGPSEYTLFSETFSINVLKRQWSTAYHPVVFNYNGLSVPSYWNNVTYRIVPVDGSKQYGNITQSVDAMRKLVIGETDDLTKEFALVAMPESCGVEK